jgi:hypothetical protein
VEERAEERVEAVLLVSDEALDVLAPQARLQGDLGERRGRVAAPIDDPRGRGEDRSALRSEHEPADRHGATI